MTRYALLIAPSSNRVYADASIRLTQAELEILSPALSAPLRDLTEQRLGGVPYVLFTAGRPDQAAASGDLASGDSGGIDLGGTSPAGGELTGGDLARLANLSSLYALFAVETGGMLRPIEPHPVAHFDDDLITIPKYAGKTNEQFTKLLLNVTLTASDRDPLADRITVLDPLCGRGTTLNQALMYGYDAIGIEHDGKDVEIYSAFLRTYLKRKRLKHRAEFTPVRRDRRLVARRFSAGIAGTQEVTVFHADTVAARDFLRAGCADVLVTDLPYGVAHGSHAHGARTRGPLDLLRAAVPVWAQLLRTGGALGMAWNTLLARRAEVAEVLAGQGLEVVDGPGYRDLAHRVDQAITRDVLVARKPRRPND